MIEQTSEYPGSAGLLVGGIRTNLEFGKELAQLTSYRTGGRARYFISAIAADEIVRATQAARVWSYHSLSLAAVQTCLFPMPKV